MRGPQPEKVAEKPAAEGSTMLILRPPPPVPAILPPPAEPESSAGTVALIGSPTDAAADGTASTPPTGTTDPANPDAAAGTSAAGEGQPATAGSSVKDSLFVGALLDPAEEAARAAAAAEVQAQQEAAMAALEEKASSGTHSGDAPPVSQVMNNVPELLLFKCVSFIRFETCRSI